jgi:Ran GTPase-activating protein (RanGAP) involved in mRNA processing and transport
MANWLKYESLYLHIATNRLLDNNITNLCVRKRQDNTNTDITAFWNALKQNTSVINVIFSMSGLHSTIMNDDGAKLLANILEENTTLEIIDISNNSIGLEGVKQLANALKKNNTLKKLYLTSNKIGDEGVRYICDALKVNTGLVYLAMGYNSLTNSCCEHICEMIKVNKTLHALYMNCLQVDFKYMYSALIDNSSLCTLHFENENNSITKLCDRNMHNLYLRDTKLVDL